MHSTNVGGIMLVAV